MHIDVTFINIYARMSTKFLISYDEILGPCFEAGV